MSDVDDRDDGPRPATTIKVCPDGPLLVRGDFALLDADGNPIAGTSRSAALCRCGRSRTKPLCDGSHKAGRSIDA